MTRTYDFAALCDALDRVAHDDWRRFLRERLDAHDDHAVLDGLARAGWRLAWDDARSPAFRQAETDAGGADLSWSIGAVVSPKGVLRAVRWEGSVFRAGLNPGDRLVSVGGSPFSEEALEAAIRGAADVPVALVAETASGTREVRLDYRGTLRYPHLERIAGTPDRLSALLATRAVSRKSTETPQPR